MAQWRLKAQWQFRSRFALEGYVTEYNAWRAGKVLPIDNFQIIIADEADGHPVQVVRHDVASENQAETVQLFGTLRDRPTGGVFHVLVTMHHCPFDDERDVRALQIYEFGVRP